VGIWESIRVALRALFANKMRSVLTMLGIIIGVMAVILLVSIGSGVQDEVTGSIQGMGSNLMFVMPGKIEMSGGGSPQGQLVNRLTMDHVRLLQRAESPNFGSVVPGIEGTGKLTYRGKTHTPILIMGTAPNYFAMRSWPAAAGRTFNRSEEDGARKVVVLGKKVYDELFEGRKAIGETVRVTGQPFLVIGVADKKGAMMGQDQDDMVFIPTTAAKRLFGIENLSWITIEARGEDKAQAAKGDVKRILGRELRDDEFSVIGQEELTGALGSILGIMTAMLAGLAGISLLVGGIGIMNIMLVSVTERTREIGIRKAVGAKMSNILIQFIIEAVALSVVGGSIGIAIGVGGALAIDEFLPTAITPWSIMLAFGFSAAVGVFFGVYPAFKAARLEPIEALRYE
jgi:putative ABC transport system permease protein